MDFRFVQALTNLISLITIVLFAKRLVLKEEREIMKRWTVVGLIGSDAITAVAYVMIIGNAWAYDNDNFLNVCKLQGFLIHFGQLSSFMWLNTMTLFMYNKLYTQIEVSRRRTVALCFGLPFAYCVL